MTASRHRVGYWSTAVTYLSLQSFTTLPSPLYAEYAARDNLAPLTITLIYAAYAVGVVASLVLAGHLSDTFGRRPVLAAALVVDAISAVVFVLWPALPGLVAGRVLCGIAVGVTASTATAYLGELFTAHRLPEHGHRLRLLSTAVSIGGLGVGPLVAVVVVALGGRPLSTPYLAMLVVFAGCAVALLFSPETRERPALRTAYRPQRLSVPADSRSRYAAALTGVGTVFCVYGLLVALAGSILGQALHRTSLTITGVLLFVVFTTGVAAVALTPRLSHRGLVVTAAVLMTLGLGGLVALTWLSAPPAPVFVTGFVVAGAVIGAGGATLFNASLAVVSSLAPPERMAETMAGFFLAGYVALTVPVIGVGVALQSLSVRVTLLGFAGLVAIAIVAALPVLLRAAPAVVEEGALVET